MNDIYLIQEGTKEITFSNPVIISSLTSNSNTGLRPTFSRASSIPAKISSLTKNIVLWVKTY